MIFLPEFQCVLMGWYLQVEFYAIKMNIHFAIWIFIYGALLPCPYALKEFSNNVAWTLRKTFFILKSMHKQRKFIFYFFLNVNNMLDNWVSIKYFN